MASQIALNSNTIGATSEFISAQPDNAKQKQTDPVEAITKAESDQKVKVNNLERLKAQDKDNAQAKEVLNLEGAIETIADFMQSPVHSINFQQDESTDKTIIKVFDVESNELIKQFPSEEVIEIAQKIIALRQDVGMKTGILLDEKV
jgi:flagellar protein FlaG